MAAEPWLLMTYLVILILVAVLPMYAMFRTPYRLGKPHQRVLAALLKEEGGAEKAAEFLKQFTGNESLNRNSTRVTLASVLFVLLALVTFHLLFFELPAGFDGTIITTILAMLGSLLSAVVGFYFGGKATERAIKAAPDISTIDPEEFVRRIAGRPDAGRVIARVEETVKKVKPTVR